MKRSLAGVDGLLFDIDGVLLLGEEVIPGAAETVSALRARGIPYRFMTNTTIYCRYTLLDRLHARGFELDLDELYTATYVAARYLHDLKEKMPRRIAEPDRTWFALAAFNIGLGHLEDARVQAQRDRLDPDRWRDVRRTLPLLALPEYYDKARLGYARGGMPVAFVDRVRAYYDILLRTQDAHQPRLRMWGAYAGP